MSFLYLISYLIGSIDFKRLLLLIIRSFNFSSILPRNKKIKKRLYKIFDYLIPLLDLFKIYLIMHIANPRDFELVSKQYYLIAFNFGSYFSVYSRFRKNKSVMPIIVSSFFVDRTLTFICFVTLVMTFTRFKYISISKFATMSILIFKTIIFMIMQNQINLENIVLFIFFPMVVIYRHKNALLFLISGAKKSKRYKILRQATSFQNKKNE